MSLEVKGCRELQSEVLARDLCTLCGACAAVVAAHLHGLVGERVDITLPGGVLTVEWDGAGECYLAGPAELVFEGEWRK